MGRFRDAITGLFTTRAHAEAHPSTTVRETVRPPTGRVLTVNDFQGLAPAAERAARTAVMLLMGQRHPAVGVTREDVEVFGINELRVRVTVTVEEDRP